MKKNFFTLVELLVVVSILAILAGGAIAVYQGVDKQAAKGIARNNMAQLESAIKNFKASNNNLLPSNFDSLLAFGDSTNDITESPDESYSDRNRRNSLFPHQRFSSPDDKSVNLRESVLEIAQSNINNPDKYRFVSWLSTELKGKLTKSIISQKMLEQLVLSGIREVRYVDGNADHSKSTAQDTKVTDSSGISSPTIERSEDIINASQAFENPSPQADLLANLGRGFTFILSKDDVDIDIAINSSYTDPGNDPDDDADDTTKTGACFVTYKPGIRGVNNISVGASETDVLIALGIGNNCTLISTKLATTQVNKIDATTAITTAPQYASAPKNIYGRYIALFKVARFLNDEGYPSIREIDVNTGEFKNGKDFTQSTDEYSPKTKTAGIDYNKNGAQFIGIIDCYGNSTDDILEQYNQSFD